jgi:hypothetical protein
MEASLRGALGEVTSRAREYLHVREYPKPGLSLSARDEHARSQRNRCILTCGRRSHDPREKKHAVEAYPIQKRKIASAIPARNSSGRAFTACGCRNGHRRFIDACDGSRPGISVVPVTRRLPLLLLSDAAAVSVDSDGHRRLCLESALAIPEQAARFQREPGRSKKPLSGQQRPPRRARSRRGLTFAAGPALQRPIPVRRRRNEAGSPI